MLSNKVHSNNYNNDNDSIMFIINLNNLSNLNNQFKVNSNINENKILNVQYYMYIKN
jgi:hypothetical protein